MRYQLLVAAAAVICFAPAVALGQTRTHIKVTKDASHQAMPTTTTTTDTTATTTSSTTSATTTSTTGGDVSVSGAQRSDTTQYGTGAPAPTPTHSQQGAADSAATATGATAATDSTAAAAAPAPQQNLTSTTTTTASAEDVDHASTWMANVTPQATAAQHDANLVGSAAWWANHKTADGQQ